MRFIAHLPFFFLLHFGNTHTHVPYSPFAVLDFSDPVLNFISFFFPKEFPVHPFPEMKGNEGWDFGPLGFDSCSLSAGLRGICRRLRTWGHQEVSLIVSNRM